MDNELTKEEIICDVKFEKNAFYMHDQTGVVHLGINWVKLLFNMSKEDLINAFGCGYDFDEVVYVTGEGWFSVKGAK